MRGDENRTDVVVVVEGVVSVSFWTLTLPRQFQLMKYFGGGSMTRPQKESPAFLRVLRVLRDLRAEDLEPFPVYFTSTSFAVSFFPPASRRQKYTPGYTG